MSNSESAMNLKIPVRVGLLCVTFSTDCAPRIVDEQCSSGLHDHHYFELRYVAAGKSHQTIAGKSYTAGSNEMILVHPREYHLQSMPQHHTEQYTIRFYPEPYDNSKASRRAFELAMDSSSVTSDSYTVRGGSVASVFAARATRSSRPSPLTAETNTSGRPSCSQ